MTYLSYDGGKSVEQATRVLKWANGEQAMRRLRVHLPILMSVAQRDIECKEKEDVTLRRVIIVIVKFGGDILT